MSVYKEPNTNTWRVIYRYTNWKGCQRQSEIVRKRRRNFVILRRRGGITESVITLQEKSVYDLLFLAHKFFTFFEAIGLALDVKYNGAKPDPGCGTV